MRLLLVDDETLAIDGLKENLLSMPYRWNDNDQRITDHTLPELFPFVGRHLPGFGDLQDAQYNIRGKKNEISVQNKQIGSLAQHHPSAIGNGIAAGADGRHRINFFAAGFIDTIHTWLQKKDRTPEQIAKFLLEMLVQLRN